MEIANLLIDKYRHLRGDVDDDLVVGVVADLSLFYDGILTIEQWRAS